jgi:hypothetical protein
MKAPKRTLAWRDTLPRKDDDILKRAHARWTVRRSIQEQGDDLIVGGNPTQQVLFLLVAQILPALHPASIGSDPFGA